MSAPTLSAETASVPHKQPFLVKYRTGLSWIPALAFLYEVITSRASLADDTFHFVLQMVGYALIGMGAVGRMWCGVYIAGRKNKELCQDGPYSLSRNPLYVFSFLGTVGIALGARIWWLAAAVIPLFWIYYYFVIKSEEATLRPLFGAEFDAYCAKVPMAWPKFSNYWSRPELTLRPHKLSEAMVDASWFLWIIILLEILARWKAVHYAGRVLNVNLPF